MQADAEVVHAGEGHRQHQRDRQRHHQPGAQAEGEEAHQQHDDQRLGQHLDELADALAYRRRLVGHLAQLHARRQGLLQALEFGVQRLAEDEDVAALLHRHGDADGVLAHEAHARRRRIVEAAVHVGHVADAEGAVADADGEVADVLHRVEAPGNPQLHTVAGGLEEAGGGHRVLLLQRLLHRRQRHAEGGQLGVGQVDPDLLVLQADQLDLADVLDPLQLQLQAVGVVLQHGIVEAASGKRVDIAEGGAELVVEERPDHALRQGEADVADLLADLVPELGNVLRAQVLAGDEDHLGFAGPREGLDALVVAGLHQLLLDALGDLARDLLGGGARPQGADHHGLEGEGRVLALPQLAIGQRADDAEQEHEVEDDLAVLQRPGGEIELHRPSLLRQQLDRTVFPVDRPYLLAFAQHLDAGRHHPFAAVQALQHRHAVLGVGTGAHLAALQR
ncbi:hypothetical protein D9M68_468750 [compost metagenome]